MGDFTPKVMKYSLLPSKTMHKIHGWTPLGNEVNKIKVPFKKQNFPNKYDEFKGYGKPDSALDGV